MQYFNVSCIETTHQYVHSFLDCSIPAKQPRYAETFPTMLYRLLKKVNHSSNTFFSLSSRSSHSGRQSSGLRDDWARAREASRPANTRGLYGLDITRGWLVRQNAIEDCSRAGEARRDSVGRNEAGAEALRRRMYLDMLPWARRLHYRLRRRRCPLWLRKLGMWSCCLGVPSAHWLTAGEAFIMYRNGRWVVYHHIWRGLRR